MVLQITCSKHPFTYSLDVVERCSISVKCSARRFTGTGLVDMCAMVLVLSLTFALSRAKTGTVFLRGINQASRDYVCDHRRVFKSGLRMRSHGFVPVRTVIPSLHESS